MRKQDKHRAAGAVGNNEFAIPMIAAPVFVLIEVEFALRTTSKQQRGRAVTGRSEFMMPKSQPVRIAMRWGFEQVG